MTAVGRPFIKNLFFNITRLVLLLRYLDEVGSFHASTAPTRYDRVKWYQFLVRNMFCFVLMLFQKSIVFVVVPPSVDDDSRVLPRGSDERGDANRAGSGLNFCQCTPRSCSADVQHGLQVANWFARLHQERSSAWRTRKSEGGI